MGSRGTVVRVANDAAPCRNPGACSAGEVSRNPDGAHQRAAAIRRNRTGTLVVLIALCLLLTGCDHTTDSSPVPADIIAIMVAVWTARNLGRDPLLREQTKTDDTFDLDPKKTSKSTKSAGNDVLFFIRTRATHYHDGLHMSKDDAAARVATEYDVLRQFVNTHIGVNSEAVTPLIKSEDTDKPLRHLDFSDVLKIRDIPANYSVPEDVIRLQVIRRWERAWVILWRAGALEPDLWQNNQLSESGMLEILDRRLRMAERVLYHLPGELADPKPDGPRGPWDDDIRVRMFEYPYLFEKYANPDPDGHWVGIGTANILEPNEPNPDPPKLWRYDLDRTINYVEGNGRRIRTPADLAFVPAAPSEGDPNSYHYDFLPTTPDPAAAIDDLFTRSTDRWKRSWIFCDHVISAVHLESLRFGKKRRFNNDDLFNAAVQSRPPGAPNGWAQLRPLLPPQPGEAHAMGDDTGRPPNMRFYRADGMSDLQIGDHIVVWNSILYALLSQGAWALENAVVVGLESEPFKYTLGQRVFVLGHGSPDPLIDKDHPARGIQYTGLTIGFFRQDLSAALSRYLADARKAVVAAGAVTTVPFKHPKAPLIQWSPFDTTYRINPEPGVNSASMDIKPWWIVVPYDDKGFARAIGRDATLRTLPDAVEYDPTLHTVKPGGPAGDRAAALFPLWVPDQLGGDEDDDKPKRWHAYFQYKRDHQPLTNNVLAPHSFYAKNIPGFVVPRDFKAPSLREFAWTVHPMAVP